MPDQKRNIFTFNFLWKDNPRNILPGETMRKDIPIGNWFQYNAAMLDLWKLSHLDTRFYRHVGQFPGWRIAFYILGFYILLGVALTTLFAVRTWPEWKNNVQLTWEATQQQWPENTSVQVQDNRLSLKEMNTSLEASDSASAAATIQKIEINLPKEVIKNSRLPNLLVVFEPQASEQQVQQYPSWFVASQDSLWVKTATGALDSFPWGEVSPNANWTLNKTVLQEQQPNFNEILNYAMYPLLLFTFLWYSLARLIMRCLSLLLMSWLAQPVLGMFGWQIDYAKTYRVGLFLLPVAEELAFLLRLLYPQNQYFSFWFIWAIALLIIGWTNRRMMLLSKQ
jgi:hypothetical protein